MRPRILPRSEHTLSRKNIDADALKVLYRLKNRGFIAYLVGGGVRDLLLGRRPKDFDVGTSAHPQQIKKLFSNCFIVGRRFRLCHVRFDRKVIEVSTFRSLTADLDEADGLIRRDNTFGTPAQDAFRRDFTVNALFYDIATFSIIDYVGGLQDLEARLIRTIGDPAVRLREDPVRMLRAVALAARLGFTIDHDTLEAMRTLRGEIVRSSPARLIEEIYKILRQGAARATFQLLHDVGLLAYLMPAAERAIAAGGETLFASLARLDDHRNSGRVSSEALTNALLAGTLLVPLRLPLRASARAVPDFNERGAPPEPTLDVAAELAELGQDDLHDGAEGESLEATVTLPFARRDLDRLRLILAAQAKLREVHRSPRVKHLLAGRTYFADTLRWMEIHGGFEDQELVAHWRELVAAQSPEDGAQALADAALEIDDDGETSAAASDAGAKPRRGRRRRGRRRRAEAAEAPATPRPEADTTASPESTPAAAARRRRRRRGGRAKASAEAGGTTAAAGRDREPQGED